MHLLRLHICMESTSTLGASMSEMWRKTLERSKAIIKWISDNRVIVMVSFLLAFQIFLICFGIYSLFLKSLMYIANGIFLIVVNTAFGLLNIQTLKYRFELKKRYKKIQERLLTEDFIP